MKDIFDIKTPDGEPLWYDIDFNKVRDIGDVINILKGMKLGFTSEYLKLNPSLQPYVKLREEKS